MVDYSKGVDTYAYLSGDRYAVAAESAKSKLQSMEFSPGINNILGAMQRVHREISSDHLGLTEHSARYWLTAFKARKKYFQRWAEIAPSTGNLNGSDMGDMLETRAVFMDGTTICYGFADAGTGRSHQVYMYVTDSYASWMRDLVAADGRVRELALNQFVLPGSHDAGMFTGVNSNGEASAMLAKLIGYYGTYENAAKAFCAAYAAYAAYSYYLSVTGGILAPALASTVITAALTALGAAAAVGVPRRALINLAYTQKDTIADQLAIGIRYFDFRPGHNMPFCGDDGELRHQHMFVPGYGFRNFLSDVKKFLEKNTGEVVVANLKFSGFMDHGLQDPRKDPQNPSRTKMDKDISDIFRGGSVVVGDATDLAKPLGALLDTGRRFIVLKNPPTWGSYDANVYNTDDPRKIIEAIDTMLVQKQKVEAANPVTETALTVLELQGTYSLTVRGAGGGVLSLSDASSPLLYTKPIFDHAIYPWIANPKNVTKRCGLQLLILLNDFADNALVHHAITMTRQRAGLV